MFFYYDLFDNILYDYDQLINWLYIIQKLIFINKKPS